MWRCFFLILCPALLFSCSSTKDEDVQEFSVSLLSNVNVEQLICEADEIVLDIGEDHLISNVDKICDDKQYLYVLDRRQAVIYLFDHDGKYISKISRKGRSNNEYVAIDDIDVFRGYIYVLDSASKKILRYEKSGEVTAVIKLNDWYQNLSVDSDRIILYSERSNYTNKNIVIINHVGDVISEFLPFDKYEGTTFRISPFNRTDDGNYYLTFPYEGRIFSLTDSRCDCVMSISVPDFKVYSDGEITEMSYEGLRNVGFEHDAVRRIKSVSSKDSKIFMIISAFHKKHGIRDTVILLDTQSGAYKSYLIGNEISSSYPYLTNLLSISGDIIYSSVDPIRIKHIREIIGEEVSQSEIMSNPTIFLYKVNW